jgi:predicted  nucleic acid-binding Zn-ribbon protein
VEAQLPEPVKREFYQVFKQRQNVAVARVINDSCSACRTRIRPALFQQLKRGEKVVCEGCRRILYVEKVAAS